MAKLTVIIPYYQKEPGILRRALTSVFAQTFSDFDVIVVDDQSPYPIDEELAPLPQDRMDRITVIRQPNAGPGGARKPVATGASLLEFEVVDLNAGG